MARHLTDDDVRRIVNLLKSWRFELTWDLLVKACSNSLGIQTTRQALNRKAEIKEEFGIRKRSLKTGVDETARPNSINTAHDRINRLSLRVKELESQNARYREMFKRWQYNAESRGIGKDILDRPLPKPSFDSENNI
ncbi:hypothetical protein Q4508_18970 [Amphritea sp. 2_MG-2023]|uniref:hypothetical protein n=1 Tax=Amphritea TaxID=515417 RepID=UPI001C07DFF0|nr:MULTISPECIES: hypothetical protein [Amphritea]MBU2967223.1 hypothetical protein [Amphritea atlantica]MDO6420640.1 hypothetical protein [Amphritea sp. 2_MG-2023]